MLKFRRYLGHDCSSWDGFNDGHYIDAEPIQAANYEEAERLCIEALKARYSFEEYEDVSHGDGPCIEVITGYYDKSGNQITQQQWDECDDTDAAGYGYRYVFVSAEQTE